MHPSVHAAATPDRPALIMAGSGKILTYAELEARSNQVAHFLRGHALARGDVVAVMLENTPDYLPIAWGAQRSGLYFTCISTRLGAAEAAYIIGDCGACLMFLDARLAPLEPALRSFHPHLEIVLVGGDGGDDRDFARRISARPTCPIADESPGADMLYSSGTTGRPKGVKPALPLGDLAQSNALVELGARLWGLGGDSVYLSPAPLYHAAPLRWCMAVQRLGGAVVVMEKFDAEAALRAIERFAVTHAQWVPTHFVRMLKLPQAVRAGYDHSSLKAVCHAAAPCPVEVKRAMMAWWGPIIHEYYSGTEANGLTEIGPQDWLDHPGSVGRPVWGAFHICDENGDPLPPRTEGAIYVADGAPFEYHNDPDATAATKNRRGWTTLGDIGWMDEDGFLYLTDRKSFMIISGGVNIYPQEVENLIIQHPKVADVAVVGAPDPDMGEKVVAVIQPVRWEDAGPALAEDITAWMAGQLSRVKTPRRIDFEQELPRHPNGKLYKRLVRDRYWTKP